MNVKIACVVVGLSGLVGLGSSAQTPAGSEDLRSLLTEPKGGVPVIARYEYELELRRAGGLRPEIVTRVLGVLYDANDPTWPALLEQSCRRRVVDCNGYLERAGEFARRVHAPAAGNASPYPAVVTEAKLQRLDVAGRQDLYRRIMTSPGLRDPDTGLTPADAGIRAIDEGLYDLVPLAQAIYERWRGSSKPELQVRLAIARALTSAKPADALLDVVDQGVSTDISIQLGRRVHHWPVPCSEYPCAAAVYAIGEVRRLNPPGIGRKLSEFLSRYQAVRARIAADSKTAPTAASAKGQPDAPARSAVSPPPYLGAVGPGLAELIGDLGDREAERQAVGGVTLWDRVFKAEQEMVKRNLLGASEVVATAPK